jgi:histidinol dehydrogenase
MTDRTSTAPLTWRIRGPLASLSTDLRRALMQRDGGDSAAAGSDSETIRTRTRDIIADVRRRGDEALRDYALRFDGVALQSLDVPRREWTRALDTLDPALRRALERAAANIGTVHAAFRPTGIEVSPEPGIVIGRRPDPLARVGVYAPGGRAAYPSSVLMGAVPARVAGVGEVIVCSPPSPTGLPTDVVLAAAALAQADRVFAIGGAGAIAAMALGTATVPRVDRIVGPGNAYVAEAKLQLVSQVTIDSPAGPSELLVLADDSATPDVLARELLAQAEHDPDAAVVAVLVGDVAFADRVQDALVQLVATSPRAAIVRVALAARSALLTCDTLGDGIAFANDWAAEHLLLAVRDEVRESALAALRHAGTIFVGESASVAFGDYMTGANHVLPTAGLARCYSGLSTLDFVRWTTWQRVTPLAAAGLAHDVGTFADAEGLPGHAAAARAWGRDA